MSELFPSALGAIIGFTLSQFVNLAKLIWNARVEPRLVISPKREACRLIYETWGGGRLKSAVYSFTIKNAGRRIATGVRCQVLAIEVRRSGNRFETVFKGDYEIKIIRDCNDGTATLLPSASKNVVLAFENEETPCLMPNLSRIPDHYEEIAADATAFRFRVAAFDGEGRFKIETLAINSQRSQNDSLTVKESRSF